MQINVTSKHLDLTSPIEQYVQEKAERLPRYFDRIEQIEVILEQSTHGFITEVIVSVEHHDDIVSHAEEDDIYASIDNSMTRSQRQLTDHKSRLRDNKHHTPTGGNDR